MLFEWDVGRYVQRSGSPNTRRHDVGIAGHHRQAGRSEDRLDPRGAVTVTRAPSSMISSA